MMIYMTLMHLISAPLRESGSFLPWVVSALVGVSFRPIFELSRFGTGSFRPKSIETIKV